MKKSAVPQDADEYLNGVPEPARSSLQRVREVIRSAAPPEATETIWYRMPTFNHHGPLISYAAFADHCSLFPGSSAIETLEDDLKGLSTSKGTIRFPVDQPPPAALLRKLVKLRVADNERRKRRR